MFFKIRSYGINGLDAYPISIEIDLGRGLPSTIIVGLPDSAVKESKERVRAAIKNSGHDYPSGRITINLSPADMKKEGAAFDLPIALGLLAASGQITSTNIGKYLFLGELSLDGKLLPINGALPIVLSLSEAEFSGIIVPPSNTREAALANRTSVFTVNSLNDAINFLHTPEHYQPICVDIHEILRHAASSPIDFSEIKGQFHVKRGLEIATAGGHNALMIGPPGSGKSMLAKRIPSILPDMTVEECLETTKIHSAMGLLKSGQDITTLRPFRSPHHTTSDVALVGGGSIPKPGEVTLSHNGILFLDELPEFNRSVLEALRQPLEDREVTIARASKAVRFPANFMLIASMNPCPCGHYTNPKRACQCSLPQIHRYLSKISGPLLDRFDIHLEVPALNASEIITHQPAEASASIKERTLMARKTQKERFQGSVIFTNAQMDAGHIKIFCPLSSECNDLLKNAINELCLSARAHDRIIKVARTIADLEQNVEITPAHLSEAIMYRSLDRNWWG